MNTNYITYTFGRYLTVTLTEEEIHQELSLLRSTYPDVLSAMFLHIKKSYLYAFLGYKLCLHRYASAELVEWCRLDLYSKLNSFSYDYYEDGEFIHSFSEKLCLGSEYCHVPITDVLISALSKRSKTISGTTGGGVCAQVVKVNAGSSIEDAILYEYSISFIDYVDHLTNPDPTVYAKNANIWDKAYPGCCISDSSLDVSSSMNVNWRHSFSIHKELLLKHKVLSILIKYPSNLPRPGNCCS